MVLAALKLPRHIPERQIAVLTIPAMFLILVMSFADLYTRQNVTRGPADPNRFTQPADAAYFSLVTITTLGYGDYTPQDLPARKVIVCELLSGALLLFLAFPVLGSRLSQFDEKTGAIIRRLNNGSWEVQQNNETPERYAPAGRLTVVLRRTATRPSVGTMIRTVVVVEGMRTQRFLPVTAPCRRRQNSRRRRREAGPWPGPART
jgi:hypothetical protein